MTNMNMIPRQQLRWKKKFNSEQNSGWITTFLPR